MELAAAMNFYFRVAPPHCQ